MWDRLSESWFVLVGWVAVSTLACAASGASVEEAPLSKERQKELRSVLVGKTWEYAGTKSNPESEAEQKKTADVKWTFREDGTGRFEQIVPSLDRRDTREFDWHLEGRNIMLENPDGSHTPYRAESWEEDRMIWFNYTMSNYYIVEPEN